MKTILSLVALVLLSFQAVAAHTVSVRVDNELYSCQSGSGPLVADPNCVKGLTDYCYSKTNLNSSQCFEKASTVCKGAPANFVQCVKDSTDYCYSKTSLNAAACFEKSLEACGGSSDAIKHLMDQAAQKSNR